MCHKREPLGIFQLLHHVSAIWESGTWPADTPYSSGMHVDSRKTKSIQDVYLGPSAGDRRMTRTFSVLFCYTATFIFPYLKVIYYYYKYNDASDVHVRKDSSGPSNIIVCDWANRILVATHVSWKMESHSSIFVSSASRSQSLLHLCLSVKCGHITLRGLILDTTWILWE